MPGGSDIALAYRPFGAEAFGWVFDEVWDNAGDKVVPILRSAM